MSEDTSVGHTLTPIFHHIFPLYSTIYHFIKNNNYLFIVYITDNQYYYISLKTVKRNVLIIITVHIIQD
jgi:hypothetical protein